MGRNICLSLLYLWEKRTLYIGPLFDTFGDIAGSLRP
jgi:hypothetical protein